MIKNAGTSEKTRILFIAAFDSVHIRRWYSYFENQQGLEVQLFIAKNYLSSNSFFSKLKYYFTIRRIIRQVIEEFKPAIINIHTVLFPNYTVQRYFKGELAVTPWNGDILWHAYGKEFFLLQSLSEKITSKIKERRIAGVLNRASLITYNSNEMKKRCEGLLRTKVKLAGVNVPGVDTSKWNKPNNKADVRRQLGIPADKFVVLSMRSLSDFYNIDIIAQSIETLAEKCRDILFMFVYLGGENLAVMMKTVKSLGIEKYVRFVGKLDYDEMLLYYQASDAGVSISSKDSCPQSVLEGMSCQLPMIAGDIPVTREIIRDKVNGLLVGCRDYVALADAVLFLKENPVRRESIGLNARQSVMRKYDYFTNMEKMLRLFGEMQTAAVARRQEVL